MRYTIKQHLFTFNDRFTIADENGEPVLEVIGKTFSLAPVLRIQSLDGVELATVRQKLMSWLPRFEVTRDDQRIASIAQKFTFFKPQYTVSVAGAGNLLVTGSLWEHEYQFLRGREQVARVSRKLWSFSDQYGVEVLEPSLDTVVLAAVIAIDARRASNNDG